MKKLFILSVLLLVVVASPLMAGELGEPEDHEYDTLIHLETLRLSSDYRPIKEAMKKVLERDFIKEAVDGEGVKKIIEGEVMEKAIKQSAENFMKKEAWSFIEAFFKLAKETEIELSAAHRGSAKLFHTNKTGCRTIGSIQLQVFISKENPKEIGFGLNVFENENLKADASKAEDERLKDERRRIGEEKIRQLDSLVQSHSIALDKRVPGATVLDVTFTTIARKKLKH